MRSSPDLRTAVPVRASVVGAFLEGWRRTLGAPAVTLGMLAVTFFAALPIAVSLQSEMERHLGTSLEAGRARSAWHSIWASEFSTSASGVGQTFTHEILGFGGTLAAISRFVDAEPLNPSLAAAVVAYITLWIFLSGGILDRFARGRPIGPAAFFSACATYFVRFARLALVIGPCYWLMFRLLHPYLFGTLYTRFTRDLTVEHEAIAIRSMLYAVFIGALAIVNLVADFTKVRAVVEDRRSMLAALAASLRFLRRRPIRVFGLYVINILATLVVLRLWMQIAPAAGAPLWLALLAGQVYLLCRLWARLAFIASEIAFFQGELAHAGLAARPIPVWPDSPAVEAIRNLKS